MATASLSLGLTLDWQASSGVLPDQIIPPWDRVQSAGLSDPSISEGILSLETLMNGDSLYYIQREPALNTTRPFFVETRMRFVSGQSSSLGRAPIIMAITTEPNTGGLLLIDEDEIFFSEGSGTFGPRLSIETDDDFHIPA